MSTGDPTLDYTVHSHREEGGFILSHIHPRAIPFHSLKDMYDHLEAEHHYSDTLKECCRRHVTHVRVMSPTSCATCGTLLRVRERRWEGV